MQAYTVPTYIGSHATTAQQESASVYHSNTAACPHALAHISYTHYSVHQREMAFRRLEPLPFRTAAFQMQTAFYSVPLSLLFPSFSFFFLPSFFLPFFLSSSLPPHHSGDIYVSSNLSRYELLGICRTLPVPLVRMLNHKAETL